ncbi:exodeoxyribonuclease VII small subunit [Planctomycetes bacterium K23_9]|uniref:Exodeoxyribonuclease 7 small subunit n=1 Tax=Stieleria marina TaxID=1930275 RepID=A0A517NPW8_9BACT|nr:Exodeoxyribonuclease 7 small subunit [Planctomycetes bacterium K23_9]
MAKKKRTASSEAPESDIEFEEALAEVEEIVDELESGDAGLTQSLAFYETGIKRLKQCHGLLQKAERRISLLSGFDADGNPITEPFEDDDAASGSAPVEAKRKSRSARRPSDAPTKKRKRPAKAEPPESSGDSADDDSTVDDSPGLF